MFNMPDYISSVGRANRQDLTIDNRSKKVEENQKEAARTLRPEEDFRDDRVELSGVQEKAMAAPDFDTEKVERIKQAIREGNYPLDSRRIAESFLALERMI